MKSVYTVDCHEGDILAADVYIENGVILVAKNTIINEYIKIRLIDFGVYEVKLYDTVKEDKRFKKFERKYKECILQIKELLYSISLGDDNSIEKTASYLSDQITKSMSDSEYLIYYMNRIRIGDEYTYTHCINTAFYSLLMGKWLGLMKNQICDLVSATLLHDLGKTKMPDHILNKKGSLNKQEYEIMKTHPLRGYEILQRTNAFCDDIKEAVLLHHERMDGSGYPYGLKGEEIHMYARIIAIADVYDAMTQNRVYKKKVSPFETFEMFLSEGIRLFDYSILYTFLEHMAPLFIGNKVKLSNGEIGEIVFIPPYDITSPILYTNSQYLDLSRDNNIKVLQMI